MSSSIGVSERVLAVRPVAAVFVARVMGRQITGAQRASRPSRGSPSISILASVGSLHEGRGLRQQADEVARCLAAGDRESSLLPLDETISIMETLDAVLAQAASSA
jgi:hypothetical protein